MIKDKFKIFIMYHKKDTNSFDLFLYLICRMLYK